MIDEIEEDMELTNILSSFSCVYDEDIENFFHNRAVEFESLSKSRTYLICDEEQLEKTEQDDEPLKIYGYISVAPKILSMPDTVSNRVRKELDGFSAKIHGEKIRDFPCYLIGQLSRASNVPKDSKLVHFYEQNDFSEISRIPDEDRPMVQMIRKIF